MCRLAIALALMALGATLAVPQWTMAQAADLAAEEQQIRKTDEQWVATVATKDPAAIAQFYTEDGAILPPGAPLAEGRDAIVKVWNGFVGMKDFSLTFAPSKISVASSGDMAYEIGTYTLGFQSDQGPVQDKGKFVVVWKKVDGAWKAAADIFNSNGAMQ